MMRVIKLILLLVMFTNLGQPFAKSQKILSFYDIFSNGYKNRPDSTSTFTYLRSLLKLPTEYEILLNSQHDVWKDSLGITHGRFSLFYRGIRVDQSDIRIRFFNNNYVSANGNYINNDIDSEILISDEIAHDAALCYTKTKYKHLESEDEPIETQILSSELVISTNRMNLSDSIPRYYYKIETITASFINEYMYVNAKTGIVEGVVPRNVQVLGTAQTRYSGSQTISTDLQNSKYVLHDHSRGNGIFTYNFKRQSIPTGNPPTIHNYIQKASNFVDNDNNWTYEEFHNSNRDDGALDAHWGLGVTYDYFSQIHGRNSFDNNNAPIYSFVHARHFGRPYDNAEWVPSINAILFFNGYSSNQKICTSLDIVAHELGHGICQYTADLEYLRESGSINESLSDIWGACVEDWANLGKQTWLIGEDLGNAERSMSNPKLYNQPDTYLGEHWVFPTNNPNLQNDYDGVHSNSGVMNYWFYLLSVGGSGTNDNGYYYSVSGIGIEKAARIVYRAETVYMTMNTNYHNAYAYTILAAQDLFGYNSVEAMAVGNAWSAVGISADVMVRDNIFDSGLEPNLVNYGGFSSSPDIWLTDQYGNAVTEPAVGQTYTVHVRFSNRSAITSTSATLTLSWGISKTGYNSNNGRLVCPSVCNQTARGTVAVDFPLGTIAAGATAERTFTWTVPDPSTLTCSVNPADPWHVAFMACINDGNPTPGLSDGTIAADQQARLSNNVAWHSYPLEFNGLIIIIDEPLIPIFGAPASLTGGSSEADAELTWRAADGSVLGTGETLTIVPSATTERYVLEGYSPSLDAYGRDTLTLHPRLGAILTVAPNPVAGGQTEVSLRLATTLGSATLQVVNNLGQAILTQPVAPMADGSATATLNLQGVPSGQYQLRLMAGTTLVDIHTLVVR